MEHTFTHALTQPSPTIATSAAGSERLGDSGGPAAQPAPEASGALPAGRDTGCVCDLSSVAPAPDAAPGVTPSAAAAQPDGAFKFPPPVSGPSAEVFLCDPRALPARELNERDTRRAAWLRGVLLSVRGPFLDGATLAQASRYCDLGPVKLCKLLLRAAPYVSTSSHWEHRVDFLLLAPPSFLINERRKTVRLDAWAELLKLDGVAAKLNELYAATIGASSANAASDRRTGRMSVAAFNFAFEPECPAALAEKLKAGYIPASFQRHLRAQFTPDVEMKLRGAKHEQLYGRESRRDWTFRLPDGRRGELPASYVLSADDMSCNHPFWESGPDGPILSRQGLYFLWAKTKVWASVNLVARVRESYTAADILRAFYKTCLALGGVPHFVEFERGIWQAKQVSGFRFDDGWLVEETHTRAGLSDEDREGVIGGLASCGVTLLYKHNAHHKHIETNFNPLQAQLGVSARQFRCIGRYAGEFERGAKQLRRVRAGSHHPRDLGFAHQSEMLGCLAEAFDRIHGRDDRLERHARELDQFPLLPITPALFAACLPGQPAPLQLRGGMVSTKGFDFRCDLFAHLGDGIKVGVKFDEADPNLGAALYNLLPESHPLNLGRADGRRWQPGEIHLRAGNFALGLSLIHI